MRRGRHAHMRWAVSAIIAGVAAFGAALVPAWGTAAASPARLPAFYRVPAHIPATPGTIIRTQALTLSGVAARVYRVMYVSTTLTTTPTAVTGLVAIPKMAPPAGGFPVVAWAHGTNGMAPQCAPSLSPGTTAGHGAFEEVNALLAQGWVVTASDYQGEGTPGPLPYLVGPLAARNTIDLVRAVQHMPAAHASRRYVVWGHSEGGQTAMFALHIGATYAPTLDLAGVVAGAPPSQFAFMYTALEKSPYRFYLLMAADGFAKAYGPKKAPLSQVLTKTGLSLTHDLTKGCYGYDEKVVDRYGLKEIVKKNPFDVPSWKTLLQANDPGDFASAVSAPLLIIQGGADTQIPVISTQLLDQHLCSVGQDVERWIYPGMTHVGVITVSIADMVHWIADRFAGGANPDPYAPVGMPGVQISRCG